MQIHNNINVASINQDLFDSAMVPLKNIIDLSSNLFLISVLSVSSDLIWKF